MNTLKILFKATECNGWPKLRFLIDDDTLLEHELTVYESIVSLDLDLINGPHNLEIERYGKTDSNVDFRNGKIQQDQLVELIDLYIDDVCLPDFFKYQGIYYYQDQSIPGGLIWGVNGKWQWKFQTPVIEWIVGLKNQISGNVIDMFVPIPENINMFFKKIDEFEKDVKNAQI